MIACWKVFVTNLWRLHRGIYARDSMIPAQCLFNVLDSCKNHDFDCESADSSLKEGILAGMLGIFLERFFEISIEGQ